MLSKYLFSISLTLALLFGLPAGTMPAPAGARVAPKASASESTSSSVIPDDLLQAVLETTARPFEASAGGYLAHSGGLDFTLSTGGLQASGEGLAWSIVLNSFGRGEQTVLLQEVEIAQNDSRLEYRREALTEWYRDTALGLEQGFTIHEAPPGAGPLVLKFDLSTGLAGAANADGRGLSFTAPDGKILHYDHLAAWDADGTPLEAALIYFPNQIVLQVNNQEAVYPITIDPLIYIEQKVIASDGAAGDNFGWSVALSGDTALVGADYDDVVGANDNQGSVYVFTRSGTVWSQQAKLTGSNGEAGDIFGNSVALSGDTALVGALMDDIGANVDQGSAYVFTRSGTTWSQQAKLTAADGAANDYFGVSVALSGDTALVGSFLDDVGANANQGSVYFFTRSGTTWSQQAKLTALDGAANDCFGLSVVPSGDTALVGSYLDDVGANADQGSVYVFTRSGTTWSQQAQLTASDGAAGDNFGIRVVLSGDTALVGAWMDDIGANVDQGSAYVFTRSGSAWSQQAKLTASDGAAGDHFGISIALSGGTTLVAADADDIGANLFQGSAYIFTRSGTVWSQQAKLTASDGAEGDYFGHRVALSSDTALVGAWRDDIGANAYQGSAYFYTIQNPTETFGDVPSTHWAWDWIERLYNAGITGGCSTTPNLLYCPENPVTRAQMAIFLERGMNGSAYIPPAGTGMVFADVPLSHWAVNWIEKLFADGITSGCGGGNYCPEDPVTRAQMAIFLLRAKHGSGYTPPAAAGIFADIPVDYWAANWIEQLAAESITTGCGGGNYCPGDPVTRAQMAVFLVRTFNLP